MNRKKFNDNNLARDLNGRRVADVKEEIRMKKWIEGREKRDQLEREKKIRKIKDSL